METNDSIFTQLIHTAKLQSGDSEHIIRLFAKDSIHEVDFVGTEDNDFKVEVIAFGNNTKQGFSEVEPTLDQLCLMQSEINDRLTYLRNVQKRDFITDNYDYNGVLRQHFY